MKILFVASGNSKWGINPLVKIQGESIQKDITGLGYFPIIGKGLYSYIRHISFLKKHLKNNKYDLIHAHYGLCGIVSQLARKKEKLVVSFMGDDLIGAVRSNGTYSFTGDMLVQLNKKFINKYDYVLLKSDKLAKKVKAKKKAVIPNGVNLSRFLEIEKTEARRRINFEQDKQLIIFVSDPERMEKNFRLAEKSVRLLNNDNVHLMVVNSIEQEKLNYYYGAADLLILTSYHEGSPNVIKEAMACNCPIVSTNVGDVEWILGKVEGCFLTSFNAKEISQKINEVLNFAKIIGRTKGRDRIIELGLDSETVVKKIVKIYEQLLSH